MERFQTGKVYQYLNNDLGTLHFIQMKYQDFSSNNLFVNLEIFGGNIASKS